MLPSNILIAATSHAGVAHAVVSNSSADSTANLTVAMVRSAPPNWPMPLLTYNWTGVKLNISETVDAGIGLIHKAAEEGAGMITFPELWFPGFPKGNAENNWTVNHLPMYINNSLTVGDENWDRLIKGIKDAGIYTALAYSEVKGDHMYMTQTLVSPLGDLILHRHKLRPSGSERWFFTDGDTDGLRVVTTSKGRVGVIECGEHIYASTRYIMMAQNENLHMAPFPYLADGGDPQSLWWENVIQEGATSRVYAMSSGSYTFMAAIGAAEAYDPQGNTIAQIDASTDMAAFPLLYASVNTSTFNTSKTYDVDGQASWAVLQQVVEGYPKYIPRVEGDLVPYREKSVAWLSSGALTTELGNSFP